MQCYECSEVGNSDTRHNATCRLPENQVKITRERAATQVREESEAGFNKKVEAEVNKRVEAEVNKRMEVETRETRRKALQDEKAMLLADMEKVKNLVIALNATFEEKGQRAQAIDKELAIL